MVSDTRTFKFIATPPERSMRRRSPESAPRLFEWLVNNGYVEEVTTYSKRASGGRGSMMANGRLGNKKKRKKAGVF